MTMIFFAIHTNFLSDPVGSGGAGLGGWGLCIGELKCTQLQFSVVYIYIYGYGILYHTQVIPASRIPRPSQASAPVLFFLIFVIYFYWHRGRAYRPCTPGRFPAEMAMGTRNPSTRRVLPDKEVGTEGTSYLWVRYWAKSHTHRVAGTGVGVDYPYPSTRG
jgi:hypothetical protein